MNYWISLSLIFQKIKQTFFKSVKKLTDFNKFNLIDKGTASAKKKVSNNKEKTYFFTKQ